MYYLLCLKTKLNGFLFLGEQDLLQEKQMYVK